MTVETLPPRPRERISPPSRIPPRLRRRRALVGLAGFATLIAGVVGLIRHERSAGPAPLAQCWSGAGTAAYVGLTQASNAATIVAVALRRGLPAHAATIALATAWQESGLENLDHGDRDSLGLFQQRPSQGWGSSAQVMDPVHASNAFYNALLRVRGYRSMPVTVAAQAVQRSAVPGAYANHEAPAQSLAIALTGRGPGQFNCTVPHHRSGGDSATVSTAVSTAFGPLVSAAPAGVRKLLVHTDDTPMAWAVADWLLTRAGSLGIAGVAVEGRSWSAQHPSRGWPKADGAPTTGVEITLTR